MHGGGAPAPRSHMSPLSPASDAASHKYGEAPGGDTLTDFVTLVCQEASNAQQVGVTAQGHGAVRSRRLRRLVVMLALAVDDRSDVPWQRRN